MIIIMWIGDLYTGVGVAAASEQCDIELPLTTDPLRELLSVLEVTAKHNFLPCLLTIAGVFCYFHLSYICKCMFADIVICNRNISQ